MESITRSEHSAPRMAYGIALILAPLLLGVVTFFWQGDTIGYAGGIIQVYSYVFWIPAMFGLLTLLRPTMPAFSVWGMFLVCWVCIAGNNFGMDAIYRESFIRVGADASQVAALDEAMDVAGILVLYLPGLLFPLTLCALGYLLWRNRAVPTLLALLLCLGALAFPASRIPRIELLAHIADLLLLVAAGGIGLQFLNGGSQIQAVRPAAALGDD